MIEIWKDIKGYEGLYKISNLGRVCSRDRKAEDGRIIKGRIMKFQELPNGYLSICLTKNKKQKRFLGHRLVALHFIPNPDNKPEVNHLDENKQNNTITNLEWVTRKENENYGTKIQRNKIEVFGVNMESGLILEFKYITEAEKYGFNKAHISANMRGERRFHKGFRWFKFL